MLFRTEREGERERERETGQEKSYSVKRERHANQEGKHKRGENDLVGFMWST